MESSPDHFPGKSLSGLRSFPLGDTVSGNPHSVCLSLPTMGAVLGYEQGDPRVRAAIRSGYPRFVRHPFIGELVQRAALTLRCPPECLFPVADESVANDLQRHAGAGVIVSVFGFPALRLPAGDTEAAVRAALFLRHTGGGLSSREAEDALTTYPYFEKTLSHNSDRQIRQTLHGCYGTASIDDIYLTRGGMSAFYGAFRILRDFQSARQKDVWVQIGWLYVDTTRILEKFLPAGGRLVQISSAEDPARIRSRLREIGSKLAGIVTETPTNPLLECVSPDLLREEADRADAALILDPTLVSPHNVNILPYADAHINSLTKYAARKGDVMAGAVALRRGSRFAGILAERLPLVLPRPYPRDLDRLAYEMQGYGAFVQQINQNTRGVVEFLLQHKAVDQVFGASTATTGNAYQGIARDPLRPGPGAVLSFTLKGPMARFYDRLRMAKSPSFGTEFSMLCPFLYLAHYDLVASVEGRQQLREQGLDPELLRMSVGSEPLSEILGTLDEALQN